jgi:hypothetical protein
MGRSSRPSAWSEPRFQFVAKQRQTKEFAMDMRSGAVRIVVITLAVIGALVVLGGVGMLSLHGAMMGGSSLHGLLSSMMGICRGMMAS